MARADTELRFSLRVLNRLGFNAWTQKKNVAGEDSVQFASSAQALVEDARVALGSFTPERPRALVVYAFISLARRFFPSSPLFLARFLSDGERAELCDKSQAVTNGLARTRASNYVSLTRALFR